MDIEQLKRFLAGLSVASLIAGSALTFNGCPTPPGDSPQNGKTQAPGSGQSG